MSCTRVLLRRFCIKLAAVRSSLANVLPSNMLKNPAMFSPRVVSVFQKSTSHKEITQSILCEWKSNNGSLQLTKSWFKIFKFALGALISLIYAAYLTYQLFLQISSRRKEGKTLVDFLWIILWGTYYWWVVENYVNTIYKQLDSIIFIKGLIQLDAHFAS